MYERGDLEFVEPDKSVTDTRTEDYDDITAPCVYLPHSCEKWVIGGPENIKALIKDLGVHLGFNIVWEEKNERDKV